MTLEARATRIREHVVDMCAGPEGAHLGGSMSLVELLTALYYEVLRVDPERPDDPERDVLVLSKGHGAPATGDERHHPLDPPTRLRRPHPLIHADQGTDRSTR